MTDHDGCEVMTSALFERHTCRPCEHGIEKAASYLLTGDDATDDATRDIAIRHLDRLTCEVAHPRTAVLA